MAVPTETVGPKSTMGEILEAFPGAQRALFRGYHIGGCSSCGFRPSETLEEVCERNQQLDPEEVLAFIRSSHEEDAKLLITPTALAEWLKENPEVKLVDIRSQEEYEAARIEGAVLLSQPVMQEILGQWPRSQPIVIVDHQGKQGLDAAAYFSGQGMENVRCLQGGIDAWSREVDSNVPRYQVD